ncbi:MAG: hypothetical protein WC603_03915 [Candidatus Paceibacterota bacterium]
MKIFVSGCYDILHAGHAQFFKEAKEWGIAHLPKRNTGQVQKVDLIVSYCSSANLLLYKGRHSSLPDDNKKILLEAIRYIDKVYKGTDDGGVWDFIPAFLEEKPDVLIVTEDDKHADEKAQFCKEHGVKFVILPKTLPPVTPTSTSEIRRKIRTAI